VCSGQPLYWLGGTRASEPPKSRYPPASMDGGRTGDVWLRGLVRNRNFSAKAALQILCETRFGQLLKDVDIVSSPGGVAVPGHMPWQITFFDLNNSVVVSRPPRCLGVDTGLENQKDVGRKRQVKSDDSEL